MPAKPLLALLTLLLLIGCTVHVNSSNAGDASLAFSGWQGQRTVGSDVLLSEAREVGPFHAVMVAGAMDVTIDVGDETHVEVSGDSNLVPRLLTEVENGVLEIRMRDGAYKFRQPMKVRIVTPHLDAVELYGSGDATITGVQSTDLRLEVYGAGDIKADGEVDRLDASVTGSGDISLYDLVTREARVRVAGSGDIRVHVTETLDAVVSGSGDVRYKGTPAASIRTMGSGDVRSAE